MGKCHAHRTTVVLSAGEESRPNAEIVRFARDGFPKQLNSFPANICVKSTRGRAIMGWDESDGGLVMPVKAGDKVVVVTREVTAEDAKSGLYYSYFGGLTGTVDRVYPDGSVCVDVDLESLSEETRRRHLEMQEAERKRWLDGLSDDVRNRLAPEQKQLKMSYRILVSRQDLEIVRGGKSAPEPRSEETRTPAAAHDGGPSSRSASAPQHSDTAAKPKTTRKEPQPRRLSEADLEAAEEAFLRSRRPTP